MEKINKDKHELLQRDECHRIIMESAQESIFEWDLEGDTVYRSGKITDKYHYQAWKELADREGIYFDEKINDRLRGVSRMQSLDIILERASREYTEEEKESVYDMFAPILNKKEDKKEKEE